MNSTQDAQVVEERVRRALRAVAETITEDAVVTTDRPRAARKSRKRFIALGIGVAALPVAFAASTYVHDGSEYVSTISKDRIVMTGSVDGSDYLLVETDRTDECGHPVPGVELVEERKNLLGSEWNTSGYSYGEETDAPCFSIDTSRYLEDPALFTASGTRVGDSLVWVYAVHPKVDTVRITSGDHTEDLEVYEVDGAGYAVLEIPDGMEQYTSELVIDGRVVPGSATTRTVSNP